jgi:hypothetical protein
MAGDKAAAQLLDEEVHANLDVRGTPHTRAGVVFGPLTQAPGQ